MDLRLQPSCLRWARERAGFTTQDLADKMNIKEEKIVAWEQSGELTLARAEKLAEKTHTPLGFLFLSQPPVETLPIKDFRTVESQSIAKPSTELLEVINDAIGWQDWYRDYNLSVGGNELAFVGTLTTKFNVSEAAYLIRESLDWNSEESGYISTWEGALSLFIESVRKTGVLVLRSGIVGNNTHRSLQVNEFRGFSLADNYAPLIFVNANDAKAAQMFTLAHELVHIWLGESGVTNLRSTYSPDLEMERFCNQVAAEILVPTYEIRDFWPSIADSSDALNKAAKRFKVSRLVILRRLRDVEYLEEDQFQNLYTDEIIQINERNRKSEGSSGHFYNTTRARFGDRLLSTLLSSTFEGTTTYRDALRLLNLNSVTTVRNLASEVGIIT